MKQSEEFVTKIFVILILLISGLGLQSCLEEGRVVSQNKSEYPVRHQELHEHAKILAPLINHQKLDSFKGKRAATPRLRKSSYWLEIARREGFELNEVLYQANIINTPKNKHRVEVQTASLIGNGTIV